MTLVERLRFAAATFGDRLFVRFIDKGIATPVTYGEAWLHVQRWAALFQEAGVLRGQPVMLALPNSVDFVGAYFGALCCGGIPAPQAPLRTTSDHAYARILADR